MSIPPSLTSQYRSRRGKKKSDEIDAASAARVLLANPTLPTFRGEATHRDLQDLSRNRRRLANQLKANRMACRVLSASSPARKALEQAIAGLEKALADLERSTGELVRETGAELLNTCGVGVNLAAVFLAEAGTIGRFSGEDAFASYCGAAPINRSSGRLTRVQVNPGGNRRLNHALHLMAVVRLRCDGGRSKRLIERKMAEGKTKRQALRVLKTYLAREVYRILIGIEQRRRWVGPVAA